MATANKTSTADEKDVSDIPLRTAAAVAGLAAGDVTDQEIIEQHERLVELVDRDESERWGYESTKNLADVESGLAYGSLDELHDQEEVSGKLETHAVNGDGIPIDVNVEAGEKDRIGARIYLSADQAEALAIDLLEQAHADREINRGEQAEAEDA